MRHFIGLVDKNTTSLAIGGFDGMHKAHQKLFDKLDDKGAILAIENQYANITPKKYRQHFTSYPVYYVNLKDIKNLKAKQFISKLNELFPELKSIVVGYDFRFGLGATANTIELKKIFDKQVIIVDKVSFEGIAIHSKTIRDYIKAGNLEQANKLLGRYYEIEGAVIAGQGIGAKSVVPTINIHTKDFLIPSQGVYETISTIKNKRYKSITFIGNRETTDGVFSIETHILDEVIKNSAKYLKINFIKKIRENKKFDSLIELKNQIIVDIKSCR